MKKEPAKVKTDPIVGRKFHFERDGVIFSGTIVARVAHGSYLAKLQDGDHIVSTANMERLGFTFTK